MMIATIILLPLLAGAMAFVLPARQVRRVLWLTTAVTHFGLVVMTRFLPPAPFLYGWLALDALGFFFLFIVSFLFLLAAIYGIGYLSQAALEYKSTSHDPERVFISALLIFVSVMSLVTLSRHLGLLWVAVEATTLASAPLIYFHRSPHSLEATWKYLLICSVGIALALLGTFFVAASAAGSQGGPSLLLDNLLAAGEHMDKGWLRVSFIFLLIGYGTKMGLAPMHTWLPDAHSESPALASALLSGVLLNCAFLGILRALQICIAAGEAAFAQRLLVGFGLLSMLLAAVFILNQPEYKRMLAYSSVEHMGILALGTGLGPAAALFVLLHALNHSLTKGLLFFSAGNILAVYKSKRSDAIRGLLRTLPVTGFLWVAGFLAITGTPPFGPFVSEFGILGVALNSQKYVVAVAFVFFLALIFFGMSRSMLQMAQGLPEPKRQTVRENRWLIAPPLILVVLVLALGLFLPDCLKDLLTSGAQLLGGGK